VTPIQKSAVNGLKAQGFTVVETSAGAVRLTKGADARVVLPDGTQKRGQHQVVGDKFAQTGRFKGLRPVMVR
jgi:hypothetical protein